MADTIEFNSAVLDKLTKALKGKLPTAQVGILGDTASRSGTGPNNAEVGAAHEFGTSELPIRSFLRVPLTDKLNDAVEQSGAFNEDVLKEVIASGSALGWMEKIAAIAEGVVIDAFGSNGFGKWAPWKNGYSSTTGNILVETGQLERSITHKVTK